MIARMPAAQSLLRKTWRIVRWPLGAIFLLFLVLFVKNLIQYPQLSRDTVAAIHAQKLTMADVDGKHLPPPPDPKLVDATVEGVDANGNDIRDDVELSIFAKYPNDMKTRAAALQFAKSREMFLRRVFNAATWKAAAEQSSRASKCVSLLGLSYSKTSDITDMVDSLMTNTENRRDAWEKAFIYTTSYGAADGEVCDIQ